MYAKKLFQVCKFGLPSKKSINVPHQQANKENHVIISIDTEKVFDKIHHSFFIKLVNWA